MMSWLAAPGFGSATPLADAADWIFDLKLEIVDPVPSPLKAPPPKLWTLLWMVVMFFPVPRLDMRAPEPRVLRIPPLRIPPLPVRPLRIPPVDCVRIPVASRDLTVSIMFAIGQMSCLCRI
jgi:hypothetical protein